MQQIYELKVIALTRVGLAGTPETPQFKIKLLEEKLEEILTDEIGAVK